LKVDTLSVPSSSVAISRLGFGCARIFGGSELKASAALLETALDCGIRHFDTAPAYGSENVLGAVLASAPGTTIATKVGHPSFADSRSKPRRTFGPLYRRTLRPLLARVPRLKARLLKRAGTMEAGTACGPKRRLQRDEVLRELEQSLRRLRRSTIDLYLLHEPEGIEITDELREIFQSLQADGVVGAYGLAFGALPLEAPPFGVVLQCRFPGAHAMPSHDAFRIYHGVLRSGLQEGPSNGRRKTAAELIARWTGEQPFSAAIFSASTSRQIIQVSRHYLENCGVRSRAM
jgi:hypothetical protein